MARAMMRALDAVFAEAIPRAYALLNKTAEFLVEDVVWGCAFLCRSQGECLLRHLPAEEKQVLGGLLLTEIEHAYSCPLLTDVS
jgi:hypothetical protein